MGCCSCVDHGAPCLRPAERSTKRTSSPKPSAQGLLVARVWMAIYVWTIMACFGYRVDPAADADRPAALLRRLAHVMTGLTQHIGLAEDVLDHRLNCRTVYINPFSRFVYWNMNYHVEHHMFPMVPYHRCRSCMRNHGRLPAALSGLLGLLSRDHPDAVAATERSQLFRGTHAAANRSTHATAAQRRLKRIKDSPHATQEATARRARNKGKYQYSKLHAEIWDEIARL